MTDEEWIPLSLTHVLYPKDDFFGKVLALISLTPFGVVVAFVTLSLFVRDIHVIFFFFGQLMNEVLCLSLKRVFRESRPVQVVGARHHSNRSYGMPSQHSQFMAFFAFYCLLMFVFRYKQKSKSFKGLIAVCLALMFAGVIYSRIYLLYHYWSQCLVGIAVGIVFASIWFSIMNFVLDPQLFDLFMNSKICRFVGISNVYIEPNSNKRLKKMKK